MITYVLQFVPDFSRRLADITDMLRDTSLFRWTPNHERVFRDVVEDIAARTLLAVPTPNGQIVLMNDACDKGIGVVLLQVQNSELVALEFWSRKLQTAERNWPVHEKEALAIKEGLKKFHKYCTGRKVVVLSDCKCLEFLKTARWQIKLRCRLAVQKL
eukprot:GHVP01007846.1.p1 GENE.GHVP01007846.1~~GHVP01007846.1.p1  ORF type:complete len:158 (+),score=15.44 GHVP01007846.1:173-646(+)